MSHVLDTPRLSLRHVTVDDAAFVRELLNEPAYRQYVGDRGVRTDADAIGFISTKILASYQAFGFGHYVVEARAEKSPIGMMGFIKREVLEHPDIGFGFLQKFWSRGYACESGAAVLEYGRTVLKFDRVFGLTRADNHRSIQLLEKLGLRYERLVRVPPFAECMLYATPAAPPGAASGSL